MKEFVAGFDIGGTNSKLGLVDIKGKIIVEEVLNTPDYPDIHDFISAMFDSINKMLSKKSDLKLSGIGIGAPNANYHKGTIELAPNLPWKGVVPFAEYVRKKTNVKVAITNDAKAAAIGEMTFGGAKKMKNFIVLTLGTGLGSGIVINGEVVYGHTGFAGELGHTTIVPGGRDCGCGRQGCLETYASATGLVRTVLSLLSDMQEDSPLREIPPLKLTAKHVAEAAAKKDLVAMKAMDFTAEKIAIGIANAVEFSSPEAVFLFGGLAQSGETLFKPVRKYLEQSVMPIFKGTVKILPSSIPESHGAIMGAAALVWNELK